MKVTLFGATGALGGECLQQCLAAGHDVTVLARTASKIPSDQREKITLVEGDGLDGDAVAKALDDGTQGILFAVGVDRNSPEDLCTDITRHIFAAMRSQPAPRFVWCGGGSTIVDDDKVTIGARFVASFANTFLGLRHRDKVHQLALLNRNLDLDWIGVRPLQMRKGAMRGEYRLGFHPFNGFSKIHFADCAHAMVQMLTDDRWLHKAPIIQY